MNRARRAAWIGALAATPLLTLTLIVINGVDVPVIDQWALVPLLREFDTGTLSLADLWREHNEHRPVVPRAIDIGLAQATGWDTRVELYLDFAVALATFGLILAALRRTLEGGSLVVVSVLASVIFFSPRQAENWLWGWQLEWFLSNLAAFGAFWALTRLVTRSPGKGLAVGAVCALTASLSLGQGLLVWPVGLALLVLQGLPWRTWAVMSVVVPTVYLLGYNGPAGHPSKTVFLESPLETAKYFALYLGNGFGLENTTGALAGILLAGVFGLVAAFVVVHRRDRELVERTGLWLAVALYALGAAMMTAIARVGFGWAQAGESRYTTTGGLLALAVLVLVSAVSSRTYREPTRLPSRRVALAAIAVPMALAALVNAGRGTDQMYETGHVREAYARCVRSAPDSSHPCLRNTRFWGRPDRFADILFLRSRGWAGF